VPVKRVLSSLLLVVLLLCGLVEHAGAVSTPPHKTASGSLDENPDKRAYFDPLLVVELQRDRELWGYDVVLDVDIGPNLYAYVNQNPWSKFDPLGLFEVGGGLEIQFNPNFGRDLKRHGTALVNAVKSIGTDIAAAPGNIANAVSHPVQTLKSMGQAASDFNQNVGSYEIYNTQTPEEFYKGVLTGSLEAGGGALVSNLAKVDRLTPDSNGPDAPDPVQSQREVVELTQGEPVQPGARGAYGELKTHKSNFGETEALDMDHRPSFAAQKAAAERAKGEPLTQQEINALRNETPAVATPRREHQTQSDTYGGRNTPAKIETDSRDLDAAAEKDDSFMTTR